mgnify:FL=1
MLIVTKRRYKKQHVIGGSGIFDTVVGFFKNLFKSNAAKKIATNLASSAAKQAGKHLANKILETPAPPTITQTSRDNLTRMINDAVTPVGIASPPVGIGSAAPNINNLMMHGNGIAIQDLVKRMNAASGKGMKIVK